MLIPTATLLAGLLVLRFVGTSLLERLARLSATFLSVAGSRHEILPQDVLALSLQCGLLLVPVLAPLFTGIVLAGVGGGLLQTGFLWTAEPLRPDLSRLSPAAGLKRLFSVEAGAELLKALLAVALLGTLGFYLLRREIGPLASLTSVEIPNVLRYGSHRAARVVGACVGAMAVLSSVDYLFQRWRTEVKLRMSRQELKEEMREQEGDPLVRSRVKSLRQKQARQHTLEAAARADVVITNPTELAVAVQYRSQQMSAPRVVAKGAGFIAGKIREVARAKGIPIVENRPLARLLYRTVEVGQVIPESLYRAVAEVLAYVYRLRGRQRAGAAGPFA